MDDKNKRIQIIGTKATRSFQRFIERQVEKWISRNQTSLPPPRPSNYRVTVEREDEHPYYHCDIEVRIANKYWRGFEGGRNIQEALAHALRHMKLTSEISPEPIEIFS
ncbi:MAG: hypothetical protein AB7F66_14565 [Bacteriovoracia bacterium]